MSERWRRRWRWWGGYTALLVALEVVPGSDSLLGAAVGGVVLMTAVTLLNIGNPP